MTIDQEEEDEQHPNFVRRHLFVEPTHGTDCDHGYGCHICEDDGTILKRVEFEAYEHERGGYPRRF